MGNQGSGVRKKDWRAPMSIRERGMTGILPVIVTSSLKGNAYIPKATVVRLDMSKHNFTVNENHSRKWYDEEHRMWSYHDRRLWVLWVWASLVSQFSFVSALRMISVVEASISLNMNAFLPIWMEVNSGKSIQSLTGEEITLKHNTRTITECPFTKDKWFERRQV